MLPIHPGSDLPCRERGVGWDGPWLDEKICKAQRHPWEVESRSLQDDCSRLVETAAESPGLESDGEHGPKRKKLRVYCGHGGDRCYISRIIAERRTISDDAWELLQR